MVKKQSRLYLLLILVVALFLRLILLDKIPNGFFTDEASNGYDAYSLLSTGKDRFGEEFPLFLRGQGGFRAATYSYLAIPFVKIFGLNEFATRLPACVLGILTIVFIYYLMEEIADKKIALLTSLFLAISPWEIQFSRTGFEFISWPFFFSLALLLFAKSFKNPNFLIYSSIAFVLSLHTYHPAKVFVPLYICGLLVLFYSHFYKNKKQTIISLIIFVLLFLPLFAFWITPQGMTRANAVGILNNPIEIIKNYLSYFSPDFLFFNGDPQPRHSPAKLGQLHWFELLTVPLGFLSLLKQEEKQKKILLLWLILYPIPAFLFGAMDANRTLIGAHIFAILSAYGFVFFTEQITKNQKLTKTQLKFLSFVILIISLIIFWKRYFLDSVYAAPHWLYGFREAIQYAEDRKDDYGCVVMTYQEYHVFSIQTFSIFVPFYTQYPPEKYQENPIKKENRNQEEIYTIGQYSLMPIPEIQKMLEESNNKWLYIIHSSKVEPIIKKGYKMHIIHSVTDSREIEYFQLAEIEK